MQATSCRASSTLLLGQVLQGKPRALAAQLHSEQQQCSASLSTAVCNSATRQSCWAPPESHHPLCCDRESCTHDVRVQAALQAEAAAARRQRSGRSQSCRGGGRRHGTHSSWHRARGMLDTIVVHTASLHGHLHQVVLQQPCHSCAGAPLPLRRQYHHCTAFSEVQALPLELSTPPVLQVKRSGEVVVNIFPVCASHQHDPAAPCRSVSISCSMCLLF